MPTIRYNASQIAALLGAFGATKAQDTLRALWRASDPEGYEAAVKAQRLAAAPCHALSQRELGVAVLQSAQPSAAAKLADAPDSLGSLQQRKAELRQEVAALLPSLPRAERAAVREACEGGLNTAFGTRCESPVLQRFAAATDLAVSREPKLWLKPFELGTVCFAVQGRIDGWIEATGEVVEIKNRAYRLFHQMRDYERLQLQTYLELCDADAGYLVEAFGEQLAYQRLERDRSWWQQHALQPLAELTPRVLRLLSDAEWQRRFLQAEPGQWQWPD